MEDTTLKNLWTEYGNQIEESKVLNMQSWALNLECKEMIQSQKAKSKLRAVSAGRIIGIVIGLMWVWFLGILVYTVNFKNLFFSVSVGILFLFNVVAIINYIRHLVMIGQINYSNRITDTQQKLSSLQAATINDNRFLLLQFPFYTTWFYSLQWIHSSPLSFWLIAVPISIAFAILGIFLYISCSQKNLHKPWVRALVNGSGFKSVTKALDFIHEIDEYKKDKAQCA